MDYLNIFMLECSHSNQCFGIALIIIFKKNLNIIYSGAGDITYAYLGHLEQAFRMHWLVFIMNNNPVSRLQHFNMRRLKWKLLTIYFSIILQDKTKITWGQFRSDTNCATEEQHDQVFVWHLFTWETYITGGIQGGECWTEHICKS